MDTLVKICECIAILSVAFMAFCGGMWALMASIKKADE